MTVFADWHGAVEALRSEHGPPTDAQLRLAGQSAIPVARDEPTSVVAALLLDGLAGPLALDGPEPATARQLQYLRALSPWLAAQPERSSLSRRVASAWIRFALSRQTISALHALQPRRGDLVLYRRALYYELSDLEEVEFREESHVVSSISESGRINFRIIDRAPHYSAPARSAWPTCLRVVAPAVDDSDIRQLVALSRKQTAIDSSQPTPSAGSVRELSVLRLWGRALIHMHYDVPLGLVLAPLPAAELEQCPASDRDAVEVADALCSCAPDANLVALLRERRGSVAVTFARQPPGPTFRDLLPELSAGSDDVTMHCSLPGELSAAQQLIVERVRAALGQ